MWGSEILRRARVHARVFFADTLNVFYTYLFIYFVVGLIIPGFVGSIGFSDLASSIAWFAFIVCGILFYAFGARTMLAVAAFRYLKTTLGWVGLDLNTRTPNLLRAWYWQAFIAMWATLPIATVAILRPWEQGRTMQLLAATFMILHIVATQRSVGDFWRAVYAWMSCLVAATIVFAIVFPQDWERWKSINNRSQEVSKYEERYQDKVADMLIPQKGSVDQRLAEVAYEINQYIAAGKPVPQWLNDEHVRLELVRSRIAETVETRTNWIRYNYNALVGAYSASQLFMFAFWTIVVVLIFRIMRGGIRLEPASSGNGGH